jgi:hypothetical protein
MNARIEKSDEEGGDRWGRASEGLTGARAAVGTRCDGGRELRRLELGARTKDAKRELRSEGERCGLLDGWCSPFYRGWGRMGRRHGVVTTGVMALTPLMAGAGLRGVKEEFRWQGRVKLWRQNF